MESNNKLAVLESLVDHLKSELASLNQMLVECGFSEGIATLKQAAEEVIKGLA